MNSQDCSTSRKEGTTSRFVPSFHANAGRRDLRLDALRGLCLIDVVLVHLAYDGIGFSEPLDTWIKHYTRFAAGGFVFLAGLTVAIAFGPRVLATAAGRRDAYVRLLRRAGLLVVVDVVASSVLRLLDPVRAFPTDPVTALGAALGEIVMLRRPGITGGILLLYAVMLVIVPLLFEIRRRWGAAPLAWTSIAVYACALAFDTLHWPPFDFPIAYWQPLFVAGFLSDRAVSWLGAGSQARTCAWTMGSLALFVMVFLVLHGPEMGVNVFAETLPLDFTKTPLRPGALLWYFAIVQVVISLTFVAWDGIFVPTGLARGAALLGRHSLLTYTAHVFTAVPILEYVWIRWPPVYTRTALAAVDLVLLGAICVAVERGSKIQPSVDRGN